MHEKTQFKLNAVPTLHIFYDPDGDWKRLIALIVTVQGINAIIIFHNIKINIPRNYNNKNCKKLDAIIVSTMRLVLPFCINQKNDGKAKNSK